MTRPARAAATAVALARAIDHPYSLAVALAYAGITHQMRDDLPALTGAVAELRELCDRYDFAYYREWGLVLDGWGRGDGPGMPRSPGAASTNLRPEGRSPGCRTGSRCSPTSGRDGRPGCRPGDPRRGRRRGQARDDLWWMPEVLRMRAASTTARTAVARLRAAARLAARATAASRCCGAASTTSSSAATRPS